MPFFNKIGGGSARKFGLSRLSILLAPTGLSVTSALSSSITVSFTQPGSDVITNYKYALSTDGGSTFGSYTSLSPVDSASPVTVNGLSLGITYHIKLRAVGPSGDGLESASVSGTTSLAAPTGLSVSSISSSSMTIAFTQTDASSITNYKYALSTNGGSTFGSYTSLSPADATSPITITGLNSGTTYHVKLRATTSSGDGSESASVSGTTSLNAPTSVEYLIVAGGGGGGHCNSGPSRNGAGGGGAGGYRTGTVAVSPGSSYIVVVGAAGARGGNFGVSSGYNGGNSSVFSIVSTGGGGGGHDEGADGQNGGSGGGGPSTSAGRGGGAGGSGIAGQGNNGANGDNSRGAGGGGAGSAGSGPGGNGNGGSGLNWNSLGTFYAGGGGGGSVGGTQSTGGSGVGGAGSNSGHGSNAVANRGGGGGGSGNSDLNNYEGGHGGSGIVIIRWPTTSAAATASSMNGAVQYANTGGYHYYTFTGLGTVTMSTSGDSGSITI